MKSLVHFIALSLLTSACVYAQEISLFNGRDLTGWSGLAGYWSVKDGAITGRITENKALGGNTFLVWQGGALENFELSFRYKLIGENPSEFANSGIQFRASMLDPGKFDLKGYQAELDNGVLHPAAWPSMANINGCLTDDPPGILLCPAGEKVIAHSGEVPGKDMLSRYDAAGTLGTRDSSASTYKRKDWNEGRLIALGNHIQIFINGIQTVDVIDEGHRYKAGLLGLQLHSAGKQVRPKTVQFKDIKLQVINASITSNTGVATIQTDPNQPRIEVLKDQGPNALEWALAPLDQPLPPDIRQNLTYLREDLLDEAKQKPKAGTNAYTLGSQLCDKLLIAIQQRGQASVQAGYTAAQADADVRVSSQALEARRNYQMSWPQFARETSQREEISRQQMSAAELKKEKTKVEWASRADVMRPILDGLYRQFREAMR